MGGKKKLEPQTLYPKLEPLKPYASSEEHTPRAQEVAFEVGDSQLPGGVAACGMDLLPPRQFGVPYGSFCRGDTKMVNSSATPAATTTTTTIVVTLEGTLAYLLYQGPMVCVPLSCMWQSASC